MFATNCVRSLVAVCALLLGHFAAPTGGLKVAPSGEAQGVWPLVVPLTRESVPVLHENVTVSYKTSYSGIISLGTPAQDFRVVFDTGSGHIVVPAKACANETCLEHRQYDSEASKSALAINVDGAPVPEDELCDQVTIGYGTGMITGEFAREQVCLGSASSQNNTHCIEASIVMAVEMSEQPFQSFSFDGIFGLALDSLAMTPEFSFFNRLAESNVTANLQFGVFLTDGESGKQSEIALGGYNHRRLASPLKWAPVALKHLGYWQVNIKELRIDGKVLPSCRDGTCRGIVDTGTSHLGVPGPLLSDFMDLLSVDVDRKPQDCRGVDGLDLVFVLEGNLTLTLSPRDYMRPLAVPMGAEFVANTSISGADAGADSVVASSSAVVAAAESRNSTQEEEAEDYFSCAPRMMPVDLAEPLGPNLFILGEPVLHRYYTVYDWNTKQIGFGLSAASAFANAGTEDGIPQDDTVLMQITVTVKVRMHRRPTGPAKPALLT